MTTAAPRLRQAVVAAKDLDQTVNRLQTELGLGEPYNDPAVSFFGLRNAVFALGDTFLEVVSPVNPDTAAGRLMQRRGGDCGYMLMFQVDDLPAARARADKAKVREVFEIDREDISEVHLHPRDMRAAIVSLSQPKPPASWPWGGDGWDRRAAPAHVRGATVKVSDPEEVAQRWRQVIGGSPGIRFEHDDSEPGLTEIVIATEQPEQPQQPRSEPVEIAGVRFVLVSTEEDR